ncbi:uncharacterized protein KIAA1958-like [Lytechinus variegatus]|uniref:uncharacterized protein KIAA1958-like n=1 Tax=Lytechinus variegatus TaxID=7654 RepID=UPI001BB2CDF6|nr:uncharacterized protein KIAA1958-like [Lytechinus variegatus]
MAASTKPKRFASFDEEEFSKILGNKDADSTKRATKQAITIFKEYLFEKCIDIDLETVDKSTLAPILSKFYVELRKSDGSHYKTASLNSLKSGLNRHLKSVRSDVIDIVKDPEFTKANVAFKAALVELKKLGKGDTVHHDEIESEDIQKLYSYFKEDETPVTLSEKVWFELSLYFCRRGRENLRTLKKAHFQLKKDANEREYVTQTVDELTKKTREDNQSSRVDGARMYATPGDPRCPVASFKTYMSKLNDDCEYLFQTPKQMRPKSGPWYTKTPMGKNTLGNMMKSLSQKAKLSKKYTNHCVRTTSIRILDKEGFEDREICQVSGHNNQSSLASYTGRVSGNQKMNMSDALSRAIGVREAQPQAAPSVSLNTSNKTSHENCDRVDRVQDAGQPSVIHQAVNEMDNDLGLNFDLDFNFDEVDLILPNSQLSVYSVHSEVEVTEEVQVRNIQDVLQPLDMNTAPASNASSARNITNRSTTTTNTHSQRMQVQQTPFLLQNCTVTINYYNN